MLRSPKSLPGFNVTAFATGLEGPAGWSASHLNGDAFVSEGEAGKILVIRAGDACRR